MPDIYINLTHAQYKEVERQMRAFEETTHGEGTDYYHKSFAMDVGGIRFEFHGPPVKARQPVLGDSIVTQNYEECGMEFRAHGEDVATICVKPAGHIGAHTNRAGRP